MTATSISFNGTRVNGEYSSSGLSEVPVINGPYAPALKEMRQRFKEPTNPVHNPKQEITPSKKVPINPEPQVYVTPKPERQLDPKPDVDIIPFDERLVRINFKGYKQTSKLTTSAWENMTVQNFNQYFAPKVGRIKQ